MKWMHLADLHVGRSHEAADLEEDQRAVLDEIARTAAAERPDGVLIAGDVYDRSMPSERAVRMLNDFLIRLCAVCPVYMISGNHDSGSRLSFAADLLARENLHIRGTYDGTLAPIRQGDTDIYLMPYLHPAEVRRVLKDDGIAAMEDAVKAVLATRVPGTGKHSILLAHLFVTAGGRSPDTCESETPNAGGLGGVDVSLFDGFDDVALGHIHGPQKVGRETVRYAGTPMMYSFSEQHHRKSICLIDLEAREPVRLIPIEAGRRMRTVRGTLNELLDPARDPLGHGGIVLAELTDPEPQLNAQERLAAVYGSVLVKYISLRRAEESEDGISSETKLDDPLALFETFFRERNGGEDMTEEQRSAVIRLFEQAKEDEACG